MAVEGNRQSPRAAAAAARRRERRVHDHGQRLRAADGPGPKGSAWARPGAAAEIAAAKGAERARADATDLPQVPGRLQRLGNLARRRRHILIIGAALEARQHMLIIGAAPEARQHMLIIGAAREARQHMLIIQTPEPRQPPLQLAGEGGQLASE